jgi:hypothetical protein
MKRPKIIVLCGSSKFVDIMAVCAWLIERDEKAITMGLHLLPYWYGDIPDHLAEAEGVAKEMDALHLRKIDISDEIFVVDFAGYIGESTGREIEYARECDKPVRFYQTDLVGRKVDELIREHNFEYSPQGAKGEQGNKAPAKPS